MRPVGHRRERSHHARGFVRGDVTNDQAVDIQDPIALLLHLFSGLPLLCLDAADFDDSGTVNLTDVVLSLDSVDLAGLLKTAWGAEPVGNKVISISLDHLVHNGWSMDYQGLAPTDRCHFR